MVQFGPHYGTYFRLLVSCVTFSFIKGQEKQVVIARYSLVHINQQSIIKGGEMQDIII